MTHLRRRLWIALALSGVAHGLVIVGQVFPLWPVPSQHEAPVTRLEAHLKPPQQGRPRALAAKPQPQPSSEHSALEVAPVEKSPAEPEGLVETAESAPAPEAEAPSQAAAPPAVAETPFPRAVRLMFSVRLGAGGMLIGRMQQTWRSDGTRYRIDSHTTAAGLVVLFKTLKFDQSSEGALEAQGLRPAYFRAERDGVLHEEVRFDWPQAQLTLHNRDGEKMLPLPAGAQDVLSLFYQTALTYRGDETIALQVATGKRFGPYLLARVGEERLDTALGTVSTVRLKRVTEPGEDNIEIWLGRELSWLPVRIRFSERKGQVFDQLLDDADIDGARPVLPATNSAPHIPDASLPG